MSGTLYTFEDTRPESPLAPTLPGWARQIPGGVVVPILDTDGMPMVYALTTARETLHVGRTQGRLGQRVRHYAGEYRRAGLSLPTVTWACVVPARIAGRAEAALQTMTLPERDRPHSWVLTAEHAHVLAAVFGVPRGASRAWHRRRLGQALRDGRVPPHWVERCVVSLAHG